MAGTVVIACKLPNGLILRLPDEKAVQENARAFAKAFAEENPPTKEGPVPVAFPPHLRAIPAKLRALPQVVIKGTAVPWGAPPVIIPGGYALTYDVDEDFWNAWVSANANLEIVQNNIVFAVSKQESAQSKSREHEKQQTGLEPIDQENDPRLGPKLGKFTTAA